ncbi:multidrug resistance efflux transporter family protein [Clostridium hydrogeniformans]|uniref:DMT family transporter n=1 Tax=Clostridium hydrogeniformans TaxID=349933 RepID=UPI000482CD81|nr:multidrug resistance efflux transporter family protein [Clostridium hydrogeniformans]
MRKAILLGIISSFFFAFTFILNKSMEVSGGSWIWSGVLRYAFMLPLLFIMVSIRGEFGQVLKDIKETPVQSTVGFGFFYAPICLAAVYAPSWIVAGILLSPLFFKTVETENGVIRERLKIPKRPLIMSLIILFGIFLIQIQDMNIGESSKGFKGIIFVIIAAFSYPLGNRKMMEGCGERLNTVQRVFGMTLCSMPFWIILSIYGTLTVGLPGKAQIIQSIIVALCSGVIATLLFFKATDMVKSDPNKLAIIEATQCGEVIFTVLGGVLILNDTLPTIVGWSGLLLVVIGMILNSTISNK